MENLSGLRRRDLPPGVIERFGVAAVGLAVVLAAPAAAQIAPARQVSAPALTLQAAIERALAANPIIAAARLAAAVNLAALGLAGERPNPEATVEFEKETPKQAYGFAVPVELGGKRAKRIALGQATVHAGDAELSATIAHVRSDVRRTYYEALAAGARLDVLRELRDLSQRVRDTVQARLDAGDAPRLELLQANLALAAADNDAAAAEGVSTAARTRLNALLGQALDTAQTLSTPLEPGGPVATEMALNLARSSSAELAVLDREIAQQRARLALAHALRVPDVVPTATLTHDAQPDFTYGWRAGVGITVPIFTTHKAGVLVEQAALNHLVAERQAALLRIAADVTAAAASAEAQRSTYVRYRDLILPQAQQVEDLAQDSYQLGQTRISALLQALQASRDLRLRSIDVLAQFHAALADLERAIGAPLP